MADVERSALGLSVGATNLAAVTAERAVTRRPVLTLYRQRPPEVGVPAENPKLTEPGLVITDFVGRAGDPGGIVAADGTTHRAETLMADALRALAYTSTDGLALPGATAVSHPAHWQPRAVDAVRAALSRVSEWSAGGLTLLPDSTAALIALQANPGVPDRGIVAVCDFGGTGTTLTLVDATNGYQAIAPALRHTEFSGDLIDQALLTHVITDLSSAGSFDTSATSALGPLTRLRSACRRAKEELSSTLATTVDVDVPGYRGDIRVTRGDLDDVIREPLGGFIAAFHEALRRNGIGSADLAAIASVGGGASIPIITTTLAEQMRVPIITSPRPHLTAAIGAALQATRGPADGATALAPMAAGLVADTTIADLAVDPAPAPALAWSEADDASSIIPLRAGEYPETGSNAAFAPTPPPSQSSLDRDAGAPRPASDPWYRRPLVVMIGTALVVLAAGAAILITLRHTSGSAPSTPSSSVSNAPGQSSQSSTPSNATDTQSPGSSASSTASDTGTPPSTTTTSSQTPTTTTSTTSAPTTSTAPTTTQGTQRP